MKLVLFKPRNIGFLLRMIKETLSNKLIKKPKLEDSVKEFVFKNAIKGNPDSVLSVMDQFALKERFLMNVGPFNFPAGDSLEVVFGIIHAQANDALSSVTLFPKIFILVKYSFSNSLISKTKSNVLFEIIFSLNDAFINS